MELSIVDLYASEYGWTRNTIMEEVYLDEYFTQRDMINNRQRQDHIRQLQVAMFPKMDDKERKKIIKELTDDERRNTPSSVGKGTKTDFKALEEAKRQQNKK